MKKSTRDVTGLILDTSRLATGEVEVKWNILEQNDGGVIQLIYCGDEKTKIEAGAVLEGQPELVRSEERSLADQSEEYAKLRRNEKISTILSLCASGIYAILLVVRIIKGKQRLNEDVIIFTTMILNDIWMVFCKNHSIPPFDF